jgi:hypothetical protein
MSDLVMRDVLLPLGTIPLILKMRSSGSG